MDLLTPPTSLLRQIILKVAQPCNLNCSYCYVYNMGDSSWKTRPSFIDEHTISVLGHRIREHCDKHKIAIFHVEIHGGEPLLLGLERMQALLDALLDCVGRERLRFSLQTNGLLLNEAWADLFGRYAIRVGVSLDGPPSRGSLRIDKGGRDSTERVLEAVRRLSSSRPRFRPGALTVLSESTDVTALIDWFPSNGFRSFDLLLPLGNYVAPPVGIRHLRSLSSNLCRGFDYWYSKGAAGPQVRLYELLIEGFLAHEITLDALGGDLRQLCVVETDGSIGLNDVARFLGGKYAKDEITIHDGPLDRHDRAFHITDIQSLSPKCRSCEVLNACGGGYLPDRYNGKDFQNPSYYCELLFDLCTHVKQRLSESVPPHAWVPGLRTGALLA